MTANGSIRVHHIELGALVAQPLIVEAKIGDVLAVGRYHRVCVGPAAVGERMNRTIRKIHAIDFAVERLVVPIGPSIGGDENALPSALHAGGAVMVEVAVRELARRAAVRRNDEELAEVRSASSPPRRSDTRPDR